MSNQSQMYFDTYQNPLVFYDTDFEILSLPVFCLCDFRISEYFLINCQLMVFKNVENFVMEFCLKAIEIDQCSINVIEFVNDLNIFCCRLQFGCFCMFFGLVLILVS